MEAASAVSTYASVSGDRAYVERHVEVRTLSDTWCVERITGVPLSCDEDRICGDIQSRTVDVLSTAPNDAASGVRIERGYELISKSNVFISG